MTVNAAANKEYDLQLERIKEKMKDIKHIFIVISGKGGVGKTSVAVNIAYALSRMNRTVGIMDVDLHGPNIAKMLGIEKERLSGTQEAMEPVHITPQLKAVSIACVGGSPDEPLIWRGPMKSGIIRQFLSDVNWGMLDYLIIDSPPGTGDEPLSVCQLIPNLSGAIVVTTPQDVAILDSRKSVVFAQKLNIPVVGIIENMSGYICPRCHADIPIFKKGGGEKAARELNVPFLGAIPLKPELVDLGDAGKPFVVFEKDKEFIQLFMNIIDKIKLFAQDIADNENTHC